MAIKYAAGGGTTEEKPAVSPSLFAGFVGPSQMDQVVADAAAFAGKAIAFALGQSSSDTSFQSGIVAGEAGMKANLALGMSGKNAATLAKEVKQTALDQQVQANMGLGAGPLGVVAGATDRVWSQTVARPASTAALLANPDSPLYKTGTVEQVVGYRPDGTPIIEVVPTKAGFQTEDVEQAWQRADQVSFGQAVVANPITTAPIPMNVGAIAVKLGGLENYDPWSVSDMSDAVNNPFYNFVTGTTDASLQIVVPSALKVSRLAAMERLGLQTTIRNPADLAGYRSDWERWQGGDRQFNEWGRDIDYLANETNVSRIREHPIVANSHGADKLKLAAIIQRTSDPNTVNHIALANMGDLDSLRALETAAPDHIWTLSDMNDAVRNLWLNGEEFVPTGNAATWVKQTFDTAIDRDEYFAEMRRMFTTGDGLPRFGSTWGPTRYNEQHGKLWDPIANWMSRNTTTVVERSRNAAASAKVTIREADFERTPQWLHKTMESPIPGAPVVRFMHWIGSRQPLGTVSRSGARPNDMWLELNANLDQVPMFASTKPIVVGRELQRDGSFQDIVMTPAQYRQTLVQRIVDGQTNGGLQAAWQGVEDDLVRVMAYNLGVSDEALGWIVAGYRKRMDDKFTYMQNNNAYLFDEQSQGILLSPDSQRQLLDSFPTLPLGEIYKSVRGELSPALRAFDAGVESAEWLFDQGAKIFRTNVLFRFGYIPKNSIAEPMLSSWLAHGTILTDEGLKATFGNFARNRVNNVQRARYSVDLTRRIRRVVRDKKMPRSERAQLAREMNELVRQRTLTVRSVEEQYALLEQVKAGVYGPTVRAQYSDEIRGRLVDAQIRLESIEAAMDGRIPEWRQIVEPASLPDLSVRLRELRAVTGQDEAYIREMRQELDDLRETVRERSETNSPRAAKQREIDLLQQQIDRVDERLAFLEKDYDKPYTDLSDRSVTADGKPLATGGPGDEGDLARGRDLQAIALQRQKTALVEKRDEEIAALGDVDPAAPPAPTPNEAGRIAYLEAALSKVGASTTPPPQTANIIEDFAAQRMLGEEDLDPFYWQFDESEKIAGYHQFATENADVVQRINTPPARSANVIDSDIDSVKSVTRAEYIDAVKFLYGNASDDAVSANAAVLFNSDGSLKSQFGLAGTLRSSTGQEPYNFFSNSRIRTGGSFDLDPPHNLLAQLQQVVRLRNLRAIYPNIARKFNGMSFDDFLNRLNTNSIKATDVDQNGSIAWSNSAGQDLEFVQAVNEAYFAKAYGLAPSDTLTFYRWGTDKGTPLYRSGDTYKIGDEIPAVGYFSLSPDKARKFAYGGNDRPLVETEVSISELPFVYGGNGWHDEFAMFFPEQFGGQGKVVGLTETGADGTKSFVRSSRLGSEIKRRSRGPGYSSTFAPRELDFDLLPTGSTERQAGIRLQQAGIIKWNQETGKFRIDMRVLSDMNETGNSVIGSDPAYFQNGRLFDYLDDIRTVEAVTGPLISRRGRPYAVAPSQSSSLSRIIDVELVDQIQRLQNEYDDILESFNIPAFDPARRIEKFDRELTALESRIDSVQLRQGDEVSKRQSVSGIRAYRGSGNGYTTIWVGGERMRVPAAFSDRPFDFGPGYRAEASAATTTRQTFDPSYFAANNSLRWQLAGGPRVVDRLDPTYWDELAHVGNRIFRSEPLIQRILEAPVGQERRIAAQWLSTPEGMRYQKTMGKNYLAVVEERAPARPLPEVDPTKGAKRGQRGVRTVLMQSTTELDDVIRLVQQYFPDERVRQMLAASEVDAGDLQRLMGSRSDLSRIVGEDLMYDPNRATRIGQGINKVLDTVWQWMATNVEDRVARWPFLVREERIQLQRRMNLLAQQGMRVDVDVANAVRQSAARAALVELEKTFYNIRRYSTPVYQARFLMSFPGAFFNSIYRYGRFTAKEPERVFLTLQMFGNLIENAGVDANGNPVGRDLARAEYLVIPGTRKGPTDTGVRIPLAAFNSFAVGLPGLSYLATYAVSKIVEKNPTAEEILKQSMGPTAFQAIFPYGIPRDAASVFFGSYQTDIMQAFSDIGVVADAMKMIGMSDDKFMQTSIQIYADNVAQWEKDGRVGDAPSFEDAIDDTRAFVLSTAGIKFVNPLSTNRPVPGQLMRDAWYEIRTAYGPGREDEARKFYMDSYGEWARWYTYSSSKYTAYIPATQDAYKRVYTDFADLTQSLVALNPDDPSMVALMTIGTDGEFSEAVNNFLRENPLPGDEVPVATKMTTEQFDNRVRVSDGWSWYFDNKPLYDAERARLVELRDNAETEFEKDYYRTWIKDTDTKWQDLVKKREQQNIPWMLDKTDPNGSKSVKAAVYLTKILQNEKFRSGPGSTPTWQMIDKFLSDRVTALAAVKNAESTEDKAFYKAQFYEYVMNNFSSSDPSFAAMFDRYFASEWTDD